MSAKSPAFPQGFVWGAAAASYQIEGAAKEDGRGESIWDRFSHAPGNVDNGDTGDVACDHYHLWKDDIRLMKEIGLHAYRFSIAWPRIFPSGRGTVNEKGLDFYKSLVDGLLDKGIQPYATLYHWDLPQALQDQGGWPARSTAEAFVEYADVVTRTLGDRVVSWATLNEPMVSAYVGHLIGRHAPGHQDMEEMLAASHHLLLAHGMSVPVIRANAPKSKIGVVLNLQMHVPASPSPADRIAAWTGDGVQNRWYLDPISGRGYPEDVLKYFGKPMKAIQEGDLEKIQTRIDFLGVNHYFRTIHRHPDVPESENDPVSVRAIENKTEMDWEIYPQGMFDILMRVHADYQFPEYYVTENGMAAKDLVEDGKVHDPRRIDYHRDYLTWARKAIEVGVPLKGYFAWSLLDNFEWGFGYAKRFGLIYVDYESQKRILKDSAYFYKDVIKTNGEALAVS
jgi:beta-glucosidase